MERTFAFEKTAARKMAQQFQFRMNHMLRIRPKRFALLLFFSAILIFRPAHATELYIPPVEARPGEEFNALIMIDRVENLAAVKLVLRYDPLIITYLRGKRTRHTDNFMHLINDKRPGYLILVMAAARGIRKSDFSLAEFTFLVNKGINNLVKSRIWITDLELMSDSLEEISCESRDSELAVIP
jgi:hypothetical protein